MRRKIGWFGGSKQYWQVDLRAWKMAHARVAGRKEAFAETLCRVVFDDIARGNTGGSYYMDGRPVNIDDPDLYFVGGAYDGIVLDEREITDEGEVQAAVELLREAISYLESSSDDPICFGFWIDSGDCYFDVSNVVSGEAEAVALGKFRGELAIYHPATGSDIDVNRSARRALSKYEQRRQGESYASAMRRRHSAGNPGRRRGYVPLGEAKRRAAHRRGIR